MLFANAILCLMCRVMFTFVLAAHIDGALLKITPTVSFDRPPYGSVGMLSGFIVRLMVSISWQVQRWQSCNAINASTLIGRTIRERNSSGLYLAAVQ